MEPRYLGRFELDLEGYGLTSEKMSHVGNLIEQDFNPSTHNFRGVVKPVSELERIAENGTDVIGRKTTFATLNSPHPSARRAISNAHAEYVMNPHEIDDPVIAVIVYDSSHLRLRHRGAEQFRFIGDPREAIVGMAYFHFKEVQQP